MSATMRTYRLDISEADKSRVHSALNQLLQFDPELYWRMGEEFHWLVMSHSEADYLIQRISQIDGI